MMSMQARETFRPFVGNHHPLRAYPTNSPRAKARLVVLALLADGRLDEREMAALDRRGAFATLGITREDFVRVLYDFCSDVAGQLPATSRGYRLTPKMLDGLFGEIVERETCEKLLQLIFSVISSDGRLTDAEESLYWSAVRQWRPDTIKISSRTLPELHYG